MLNKKGIPEIITLLLTCFILFYFYHEVILDPNNYLFSGDGDGVKNYYTYLYHATYDHSFWDFSGMNYPYYEHMVYTDGHPLLSWCIGILGLSHVGVGVLNILMLLAYPVCAFVLYKILRHYQLSVIWAIVAAVVITFLSPQVGRMTGHFSLSYVFAIPGMWWLLIKASSSNHWKWPVLSTVYVLLFFFTHPYLGMILAVFACAFWLVYALINNSYKSPLLKLFIMGIAPILLFQLIVFLTDTHVNRSGEPQGFYDFYARFSSILTPKFGPIHSILELLLDDVPNPHWETVAYIGFATILFCLIIGAYVFFKRKELNWSIFLKSELFVFLLAGTLVLIFSFCIPFRWQSMRWLADTLTLLKQFRAIGRFAWVFFYIINVTAVIGMYRIYLRNQKLLFPIAFFLLIGVEFLEAAAINLKVSERITTTKNPFKIENVEPQLQEVISFINESDYDAVIMLPFQHMSSESLMILGDEETNFDSFVLSYHSHKPLLNSTSSRMSVTEAIQFNNFFSLEYVEKKLVDDLPENAKILVVKKDRYCKEGEMRLVFSSNEVFRTDHYLCLEFDRKKWNTPYYFRQIEELDKQSTVYLDYGFRTDTTGFWFKYEPFEINKGVSFAGEGAFQQQKEPMNIIDTIEGPVPPGGYILSFWYYIGKGVPTQKAVIDHYYSSEQKGVWEDEYDIQQSNLIVDDWCRVVLNFTWTEDTEQVILRLYGWDNNDLIRIDELLVYPAENVALFKHAEREGVDYIIYNNEWLRADSFSN